MATPWLQAHQRAGIVQSAGTGPMSWMIGVITVTASYDVSDSTYGVELVKLVAAYIENPGASGTLGNYITPPIVFYDPATGKVALGTSNVCISNTACEVKDLVLAGALQSSDGNGKSAAALAVRVADATSAGLWMQDVAGTGNPFINSVGSHFYSQVKASRPKEAYFINPRKDPASTSVAVGSSISTTVVVFALWKIDIAASTGSRRSSRMVLQTVQGSRGGKEAVSAAVRIEVSAASLAASVLGVSPDLVTAWAVELSIQDFEACLPTSDLMVSARSFLVVAFAEAATALREVHIAGIRVNKGTVDCANANHRRTASTPSMLVDALVIFTADQAGPKPFVDLGKLQAVPGIRSAVQTEAGALVEIMEARDTVSEVDGSAKPTENSHSQGFQLTVVSGAGVAGGAMLLLLGAALWVLRRGQRHSEAPVVHMASLSYLTSKEEELTVKLDDGLMLTCTVEMGGSAETHS